MKSSIRRELVLAALGLALAACEEDTTTTTAKLCTPAISEVAPPAGSADPAVTTRGGELELRGRNFWTFFSATLSDTEEAATFSDTYDLLAYLGGVDAPVLGAWEQTIALSDDAQPKAADGTEIASNCLACSSCVEGNAYGCGGCDAECLGCEQVVLVEVPPLSTTSGKVSEDGSTLTVGVTLITGINQSPMFYYDLSISECADGVDNDGDGEIDSADPDCEDGDVESGDALRQAYR